MQRFGKAIIAPLILRFKDFLPANVTEAIIEIEWMLIKNRNFYLYKEDEDAYTFWTRAYKGINRP